MKISSSKRSFGVYLGLILMLVALVLFSVLPLITSIIKGQNLNQTSPAVTSQLDQAALGYQLVIEREPENQSALRGLLNIRLQQGDLKGAIDPLSRLSQLNPDILDYQLLLAQTQAQIEDYTSATATYRQGLERYPGNLILLKSWTDLLVGQNRFEEAISVVKQEILSKNTTIDTIGLQLLLGEIYTAQGKPQEAINLYDQIMITDNKDFRPVLAKALLLQKEGNTTELETLFDKAIELAPVAYKDQIKELANTKL